MPAVAAVTPPTKTAATAARAIQDMPCGPLPRRKLNLIDAHRLFLRGIRPQPGTTYTARCGVHRRPGWVHRGQERTGAAAALGVTATAPGLLPCPRQGGVARCPAVPCTTSHGYGSRLVQRDPVILPAGLGESSEVAPTAAVPACAAVSGAGARSDGRCR